MRGRVRVSQINFNHFVAAGPISTIIHLSTTMLRFSRFALLGGLAVDDITGTMLAESFGARFSIRG